MQPKFYIVGGYVRDKILGLSSKDIDFAVEAESYEAMKRAVVDRGCDIKVEKPEYATVRAVDPVHGGVDFVLCRKDGFYSDGRRPDDVSKGTLFDDLQRRDFTVNALAMTERGEIIDYFGGEKDIKTKTLKTVGSAEDRFNEDSLRILRALRFSITKGFAMDSEIRNALENPNVVYKLKNISEERIREELTKMLKHDTWSTLSFFNHYGCIRYVLKENFPKLWLKPTVESK